MNRTPAKRRTHSPLTSTLSSPPPVPLPVDQTPAKRRTSSAATTAISSPTLAPETPGSTPLRRSSRLAPSSPPAPSPQLEPPPSRKKPARVAAPTISSEALVPKTPNTLEPKRRRRGRSPAARAPRRRAWYERVVFDGCEFRVGDDVYLRRRDGEAAAESDAEEPEAEECRICFQSDEAVMVECDDCLGGFHLGCLRPPLPAVPEGDWLCPFCEARRAGREAEQPPQRPDGRKLPRTAKEKLLAGDMWAARIKSLWRETNGTFRARCQWYIIPEETAAGRQPHNLRRELYRTNDFCNIEMESIVRHCSVMCPEDFRKANNDGDDVFYCEYEYDVHWHNFKRLTEIDEDDEANASEHDKEYDVDEDSDSKTDIDSDDEQKSGHSCRKKLSHEFAANLSKGRIYGLQKIGTKIIPERVRCGPNTNLERAKSTLLLATLPKSVPCRDREMEEIKMFVKGAICNEECLGRCLYIHGVPGTGKTMSVLSVMNQLRSEVDYGTLKPYCFINVNGLKLSSPETIYKVIYEQLSGHRVGWKKALHFLTNHFSEGVKIVKKSNRPIVLLIDELDLLVTRNQSVLYNILDWPTRPNSKLIVIGIANTMDLPEKLLPRISSRMGIQRLCFGPYNYKQLQEIITSRLKGIDAFEEQAIEFASRKVAAMSGDARRALEICRHAAELADYRLKLAEPMKSSLINKTNEEEFLVKMADVEAAIQEVFQAPHIRAMKNSSKFDKIVLVAIVHEIYKSGLGEVTFETLATRVLSWCHVNREPLPGYDTLLKICCKLGESKIILCEDGAKHRLQKLQLNFPSDDVAFALKESPELPWLSKYL